MNEPQINEFLIITFLSLFLLLSVIKKYKKKDLKACLFLGISLITIYCYNGLAVYDATVPRYFIFMYAVYVVIYFFAFNITYSCLNRKTKIGNEVKRELFFTQPSFCKSIIISYVLVNVLIIIVEGKSGNFFKIPELDASVRFERFVTKSNVSIVSVLLGYINSMLKPLFYISLYNYRKKLICVIPLVLLPSYFTVVSTGYISRGGLLLPTIMIAVVIYFKIKKNKLLVASSVVVLFYVIIYYSFYLSLYRRGMDVSNIDFSYALNTLILEEFSYPLHAKQIINYDKVAGIADYFLFVITLPIPKIFLNLHIEEYPILFSEYMLGLDRTSSSFYILLPGCVLESYFIYGKYLFWIHPLTIAIVSAYICKISSKQSNFVFFYIYLLISFSWAISRAGFYSIIPTIIAPFYIFYWLYYYKSVKKNV